MKENLRDYTKFYSILVCPKCRVRFKEKEVLCCPKCGHLFSMTETGKPVLLDPETARVRERMIQEEKIRLGVSRFVKGAFLSRLAGLLKPPSFSLNTSFPEIRKALLGNTTVKSPLALFIGGIRRSDLKYFGFSDRVVIDIKDSPQVDMIADAHKLPFPDQSFDILICQAVLEHVIDASAVLGEIYRVTKPGGLVYVSIPFIQPYHSSPSDFRRFTLSGLESEMEGYQKISSGVASGPGSAMARLMVTFVMSFSDGQLFKRIAFYLSGWLFFWLKYLDLFLRRKKSAHLMSAAVYYVGKKQ